MEGFYSTVFVAVLALFGLLVAALIYVAQTVADRYSTRIAQRLLRGRLSLAFWAWGVLASLLSSAGLFNVSFPGASQLPHVGPAFAATERLSYGLLTLLAVLVMLVLFWLTLRSYSRLISPLGVLDELVRGLSTRKVRDIALFRLHRSEPEHAVSLESLARFLQGLPQAEGSGTSASDARRNVERKEHRNVLSFFGRHVDDPGERQRKKIEEIKNALRKKEDRGKLEDPLSDVFEYSLLALARNNEFAWRRGLSEVLAVFRLAVDEGLMAQSVEIPFLADDLLLQWFERVLNEIDISGRYSFGVDVAETIRELCAALNQAGLWQRTSRFLGLLQSIGERAILKKDALTFGHAIKALAEIGVFSLAKEEHSRVFDDVCKYVGWLGERLILRGIDDAPIMPSGKESEELGIVREAVYQLTTSVCDATTDKYPLILRDAIEVIADQALAKNAPTKYRDTLVELLGHHGDLARHLIRRESPDASAYLFLILMFFEKILKNYDLSDYGELRRDIFYWVSTLGQEAVLHNQSAGEFWRTAAPGPRDLQGMIIDFMTRTGIPDDWAGHMLEVFVKSTGHMDQAWQFVKRAGMAVRSNFGLMFDWETGDDYAPDDPRRH